MKKNNLLKRFLPFADNNILVYSELSDCHYSPKSFPAVSIKYVISGQENYYIEDKEFIVGKGQFVLVNPHQIFEYQIPSRTPALSYCMNISEDIIQQVGAGLQERQELLLDDPSFRGNIRFEAINMVQGIESSPVCRDLLILGNNLCAGLEPPGVSELYFSFAEKLIGECNANMVLASRLGSKNVAVRDELFRRINMARELIESAYLEELSIKGIAEKVLLSEYYFLHIYKRVFGISPHQHIIRKRMQFAAWLLKQDNQSMDEIASITGYPDIYSFSKSFKKQFKTPPAQFRRSH